MLGVDSRIDARDHDRERAQALALALARHLVRDIITVVDRGTSVWNERGKEETTFLSLLGRHRIDGRVVVRIARARDRDHVRGHVQDRDRAVAAGLLVVVRVRILVRF